MKSYTKTDPVFSKSIKITEVIDAGHADFINEAPKQLLENTLVNHEEIQQAANAELVEYAFYSVFTKMPENEEKAMTLEEINTAISTAWNGEASPDPTALSSAEIEDVIN